MFTEFFFCCSVFHQSGRLGGPHECWESGMLAHPARSKKQDCELEANSFAISTIRSEFRQHLQLAAGFAGNDSP